MALATEMDKFIPDADHINALPGPLRKYIHDLETRRSGWGRGGDCLAEGEQCCPLGACPRARVPNASTNLWIAEAGSPRGISSRASPRVPGPAQALATGTPAFSPRPPAARSGGYVNRVLAPNVQVVRGTRGGLLRRS